MTTTDLVASAAVAVSLASVVGCIILVPCIFRLGSDIQQELLAGMSEFKTISDSVYLMILSESRAQKTILAESRPNSDRKIRAAGSAGPYKAGKAFYYAPYGFVASPAYYSHLGVISNQGQCQCSDQNPCPPGPAGNTGEPGADGQAGNPGKPGVKGPPGSMRPTPKPQTYQGCKPCPAGPKGGQGNPGPAGKSGPKGSPGKPGPPAKPGPVGPKGPAGPAGSPGNSGKDGPKGPPGKDGTKYDKGEPGVKGSPGKDGPPGPPGGSLPGKLGPPGAPGGNGVKGQPGPPGQKGSKGNMGPPGKPGGDGKYCPCPAKNSYVKKNYGSYAGRYVYL